MHIIQIESFWIEYYMMNNFTLKSKINNSEKMLHIISLNRIQDFLRADYNIFKQPQNGFKFIKNQENYILRVFNKLRNG